MFALKKNHEKRTKNNYKLQKNHIYFLIVLIKKLQNVTKNISKDKKLLRKNDRNNISQIFSIIKISIFYVLTKEVTNSDLLDTWNLQLFL